MNELKQLRDGYWDYLRGSAAQLRAKFETDLSFLQAQCEHNKSEWMASEFAPGHTAGSVMVCLNCEKVMERDG